MMMTYRRSFLALFFQRMIKEALDLKHLGRPEEAGQLVLLHLDLAGVHEVEQQPQVLLPHVPQDDDRVLAWVTLKTIYFLQIFTYIYILINPNGAGLLKVA